VVAALDAVWDAEDTVAVSGQFQARSMTGGAGDVAATLLVDGLGAASTTAFLQDNGVTTIPIQVVLDDLQGGEHRIELVGRFFGQGSDGVAYEQGNLIVQVFSKY
jgi:hypothetical protein